VIQETQDKETNATAEAAGVRKDNIAKRKGRKDGTAATENGTFEMVCAVEIAITRSWMHPDLALEHGSIPNRPSAMVGTARVHHNGHTRGEAGRRRVEVHHDTVGWHEYPKRGPV